MHTGRIIVSVMADAADKPSDIQERGEEPQTSNGYGSRKGWNGVRDADGHEHVLPRTRAMCLWVGCMACPLRVAQATFDLNRNFSRSFAYDMRVSITQPLVSRVPPPRVRRRPTSHVRSGEGVRTRQAAGPLRSGTRPEPRRAQQRRLRCTSRLVATQARGSSRVPRFNGYDRAGVRALRP